MHVCDQWRLHCTSQWGGRCHWVNMCTVWPLHSKWLREHSTESASSFAISLNIPPWKLFRWFRRPQRWATGDWQLHHNMSTHVSCLLQSFLAKHQITRVTQPPYSPELALWDFGLFPKLKSPLLREEISDHWWDSGKYHGTADGNWENCMRSQGAYLEGD